MSEGAYLIHLYLSHPKKVTVGSLGKILFLPGNYFYIGSALRGIEQRVKRYLCLAQGKTGGGRWHIDSLLKLPEVCLVSIYASPGVKECTLSHTIAVHPNIVIPVPKFGATDCRYGCKAHLYYMNK
jgi:Uri superfamily endonuclease